MPTQKPLQKNKEGAALRPGSQSLTLPQGLSVSSERSPATNPFAGSAVAQGHRPAAKKGKKAPDPRSHRRTRKAGASIIPQKTGTTEGPPINPFERSPGSGREASKPHCPLFSSFKTCLRRPSTSSRPFSQKLRLSSTLCGDSGQRGGLLSEQLARTTTSRKPSFVPPLILSKLDVLCFPGSRPRRRLS